MQFKQRSTPGRELKRYDDSSVERSANLEGLRLGPHPWPPSQGSWQHSVAKRPQPFVTQEKYAYRVLIMPL